jgi:hypothetical protein
MDLHPNDILNLEIELQHTGWSLEKQRMLMEWIKWAQGRIEAWEFERFEKDD